MNRKTQLVEEQEKSAQYVKQKIGNKALNDRIEMQDELRRQIDTKIELQREEALEQIFDSSKENDPNKANISVENDLSGAGTFNKEKRIYKPKKNVDHQEIRSLGGTHSGKNQLSFTEKVYPHLAMREKFLKKIPEPKNSTAAQKEKFNYLFYKDKGDEFLRQEDLEGAIEAYTVSLDLKPDHLPVLVNRSLCWFRQLSYVEALWDIEKAITLIPAVKSLPSMKSKFL